MRLTFSRSKNGHRSLESNYSYFHWTRFRKRKRVTFRWRNVIFASNCFRIFDLHSIVLNDTIACCSLWSVASWRIYKLLNCIKMDSSNGSVPKSWHHYLNQCWLIDIVGWTLRTTFSEISNKNMIIYSRKCIWKCREVFSGLQCVNHISAFL